MLEHEDSFTSQHSEEISHSSLSIDHLQKQNPLDKRNQNFSSSQSNPEEILKRTFQRNISRHIAESDTNYALNQNIVKGKKEVNSSDFKNRFWENTSHPSQICSGRLRTVHFTETMKIREKVRQNNGHGLIDEDIKKLEQDALQNFYSAIYQERKLSQTFIPANAKLKQDTIEGLQSDLFEINPEADLDVLIAELESKIINEYQDIYFDEAWETAKEARQSLLYDLEDVYSVWIDFDGAKRPEGTMFSMYAYLVYEDIQHGVRIGYLNKESLQDSQNKYHSFLKTDSLIFALTELLKKNGIGSQMRKDTLEELMEKLKGIRKKKIKDLVIMRNLVEHNKKNTESEEKLEMVFLSKQVRFLPRLDHKFIEALKLWDQDAKSFEKHAADSQKNALSTLKSIKIQIKEINELAELKTFNGIQSINNPQGFSVLVPQIMIAQAQGAEDVKLLHKYANKLECCKDVSIVPLFEEKITTNSEEIQIYLSQMWEYFITADQAENPDAFVQQKKYFETITNEVFFAGSDLSKEISSLSALHQVWKAALEIEKFNKNHDTDIRVKLGSGEALFRQLGYLDPEGFKPLIRGKILSPKETLNQEEEQEISHKTKLLQTWLGEDWQNQLKTPPSGFNFLFKKHPWINSFTKQSRAREMMFFMSPSQIKALLNNIQASHQENFNSQNINNSPDIPVFFEKACEASEYYYKKIMGDTESDSLIKPGGITSLPGLLEVFAQKVPANRSRTAARNLKETSSLENVYNLEKKGVDARAIATNTVSNFIFPLALLGQGSALEAASQAGELEAFLTYLPLKDLLREIRSFEMIQENIFNILNQINSPEINYLVINLSAEWERIQKYKQTLQKAYLNSLKPENIDNTKWSNFLKLYKKDFVEMFVPGIRTLLDDNFVSDRMKGYQDNFQKYGQELVQAAGNYLNQSHQVQIEIAQTVADLLEKSNHKDQSEESIRKKIIAELESNHFAEDSSNSECLINQISDNQQRKKLLQTYNTFDVFKINQEKFDIFLKNIGIYQGRIG